MVTSSSCSFLAITALPDDRPSTLHLGLILSEVARRPGHRASLWYLRSYRSHEPTLESRTIDSLRTWPPAAAADFVGLHGPAAHLRGVRLRMWLRSIQPDVVLLDDGLGRRVLDPLPVTPPLVARYNSVPPELSGLDEPTLERTPELTVLNGTEPPPGAVLGDRVVREFRFPHQAPRAFLSADRRNQQRQVLGIPADVPLVVGCGDDGWLDGPDLFLRALWSVRNRYDIAAHGVWFGLEADTDERDRLLREAARMGFDGSFHICPSGPQSHLLCGDVVFYSHRSTSDGGYLDAMFLSGTGVVAFESTGIADPSVRVVADIDVEAAAEQIAAYLSEDRSVRELDARRRLDRSLLVDEILSVRRR